MLSCEAPVTLRRQLGAPRQRSTPRKAKIRASLNETISGSGTSTWYCSPRYCCSSSTRNRLKGPAAR